MKIFLSGLMITALALPKNAVAQTAIDRERVWDEMWDEAIWPCLTVLIRVAYEDFTIRRQDHRVRQLAQQKSIRDFVDLVFSSMMDHWDGGVFGLETLAYRNYNNRLILSHNQTLAACMSAVYLNP